MRPCAKRSVQFAPPHDAAKEGWNEAVKTLLKESGSTISEWDAFFNK